jgi:8-oxo-dGTP diphosphatase
VNEEEYNRSAAVVTIKAILAMDWQIVKDEPLHPVFTRTGHQPTLALRRVPVPEIPLMPQRSFALSVKALILDEDRQCLVLRRSAQSKNNAGLWDLPGGKCDPGEAMEVALAREVAEETGLQVELTRVVGAAQSELPDRVVAYLLLEAKLTGGEVRLSGEHDAYRWEVRRGLAVLPFAPQFREFIADYARGGE